MLHKISSLKYSYEKCPLSRLKRVFQSDINYKTYDKFVPSVKNQVVGNLPPEMIKYIVTNFPDRKAEMIKKFHKGLALTAMFSRVHLRKMKQTGSIGEDENMQILLTQMKNILRSNISEILPKNSSVHFKYTGSGAMGNVFQLSIKDENGQRLMPDSAMKIFHDVQNDIVPHMHGSYAEANISTFLKKAMGHKMEKSEFARHYMSDLKSGYSLSEFIHHDGDYNFKFLDYARIYGVNSMDAVKSLINGKIYDMGGFLKIWNFTPDKVTRRYFKKLVNNPQASTQLLKQYQTLLDDPKTPHRDKILDAIDLYYLHKMNKHNYIQEYQDVWTRISAQE